MFYIKKNWTLKYTLRYSPPEFFEQIQQLWVPVINNVWVLTQAGQFLNGVKLIWIQSFPSPSQIV